jgi:GT2 family glycosyltransferase
LYNENEKYLLDLNIDPFNVDQYFEKLQNDKVLDYREHVYQEIGDDLTVWPAPWSIFWTAYVSVGRETLIRVGMFDESFTTWGCEDTDLGISLHINGIQIVLNRDLKCIH